MLRLHLVTLGTYGNERSLLSSPSGQKHTILADRYRLGEVLGRGGMADVYRGTDQVLGRDVAVKLLRQPGPTAPERERFLAEAKTLAALSHPALVTILDFHSADDCTFLVMELVEGGPLSELYRPQPLDERRVAEIGAQLADALAYVHSQGIVHRDIKPENVLIGDDGRVRLADFGIARLLGDLTRHTATGFTMGTAAYVAPEQLQDRDVSKPADIYSLGLVLLQALTGKPAFTGTSAEICLARLNDSPNVPTTLSTGWQSLLSQMTAMDPQARSSSASVSEQLSNLTAQPSENEASSQADTQMLSSTQTRPLTTPIAVVSDDATGDPELNKTATPAIDYPAVKRAVGLRLTKWTEFSTRGRLVFMAVLLSVVVVCIVLVVNSSGGGNAPSPTPVVPGKMGQDLQQLHDAVNR